MREIDKVPFNSDVVNDNDYVYFPSYEHEVFALARFPVFDNEPLQDTIKKAMRKLNNEYIFPTVVFIPFARYSETLAEETEDDVLSGRCISSVCNDLDLQMLVMTPDSLKDKVTYNNDRL